MSTSDLFGERRPRAYIATLVTRLVGIMGLDIADGQIQTIHSLANPDKLRHLLRAGTPE